MRIVVTGGSGNVGTSVLTSLAEDPDVGSVLALARRQPSLPFPKTEWVAADVSSDDLRPHVEGRMQSCTSRG